MPRGPRLAAGPLPQAPVRRRPLPPGSPRPAAVTIRHRPGGGSGAAGAVQCGLAAAEAELGLNEGAAGQGPPAPLSALGPRPPRTPSRPSPRPSPRGRAAAARAPPCPTTRSRRAGSTVPGGGSPWQVSARPGPAQPLRSPARPARPGPPAPAPQRRRGPSPSGPAGALCPGAAAGTPGGRSPLRALGWYLPRSCLPLLFLKPGRQRGFACTGGSPSLRSAQPLNPIRPAPSQGTGLPCSPQPRRWAPASHWLRLGLELFLCVTSDEGRQPGVQEQS